MGRLKKREKGAVSFDMVTLLIFLGISAFIIILVAVRPFFSPEIQLSGKEMWCRFTLSLRQSLPDVLADQWHPICSAERLSLSTKEAEKTAAGSEKTKDGAVRYILDLMRRCKFMVGGDQSGVLFSEKNCYICYVVDTANDDALFPLNFSDFYSYSLFTKTEKDESYLRALQSPGEADYPHVVVLPTSVEKGEHYAIVYLDNVRPDNLVLWSKPLVACAGAGYTVGKFTGFAGAGYACLGGALLGGASSVVDLFAENTNKLAFVDLRDLKEREGTDELGCSGYVY